MWRKMLIWSRSHPNPHPSKASVCQNRGAKISRFCRQGDCTVPKQPLNPGPSKGPDPMASAYESVGHRMNAIERELSTLVTEVRNLVSGIAAQKESIDRMERAVTDLVTGIRTQNESIKLQSESTKEFLAAIREQNQIVKQALAMANPSLAGGKA